MSRAISAAGTAAGQALGIGSLRKTQQETLTSLVRKHITDPSLNDFSNEEDFTVTSLERGIPRYEHPHLVAALDVLLMYQRDRRARSGFSMIGSHASMGRSYKHDPRTRLVELLKRWLRGNAGNLTLGEDELRSITSLCRDIQNYPRVFPSRNPRSFMHTLAEVYEHLELQLREVLERDRTCAELAARVLSCSRNLIADSIAYLLLAATDLKSTDKLPSLEVVSLWPSLPLEKNPLPARADPAMQKLMKGSWETSCGSLVEALLSLPWAFRLFDGASAEEEARRNGNAQGAGTTTAVAVHPAERVPALIKAVEGEFEKGHFASSGLCGNFRDDDHKLARAQYLAALEAVFDLLYLLGEVIVQFQRISDGLGDYGMIRVSPWLHPILESIKTKVQHLKANLEALSQAVDNVLVLGKARGRSVKKPAPSERMSARAHAAIDRAITSRESHASLLLAALEELRARSAPERLPHVMGSITDACQQLQSVLSSAQFRMRVGDSFPEDLPALGSMGTGAVPGALPGALPGAAPALTDESIAVRSLSDDSGGSEEAVASGLDVQTCPPGVVESPLHSPKHQEQPRQNDHAAAAGGPPGEEQRSAACAIS
mmetsp:Transcript_94118/g.266290  ORF Transcript_94118/g.266290 Transcript_94118/m.266290 type:complete len:602 (+) Transcript_94118:53-1858(+)